ncbi:MAG: type I phosphomannose isomerase catalytic subunit, partial [Fusobacteriaceae bacterium]
MKKIWGGRGFEESLDIPLVDSDLYGESWEVSSHSNGMSFVENGEFAGRSLQELLENYGEFLVGKSVYDKYGDKFPLLIKYLDINDKLSVQVHPDDEYALRVEGEFGKSETWYVLEASHDATLILGTKDGITADNFLEKFESEDFSEIFNIVSVKKGDFIDVQPGLVHASLTGSIMICETQQNSDTTYRIYDFDRVVDGKKRELHLERAVQVIDFNLTPTITEEENREVTELENCTKHNLVENQYFKIERLDISGEFYAQTDENFKVYSILEGSGKLIHGDRFYPLKTGDTYFIPAGLELYIVGDIQILK